MNLKEFFVYLGHVLGLVGNNGTTTDLSTTTFSEASTPIILDTSSFKAYRSSQFPSSASPKILSSLFSEKTYETTTGFVNSRTAKETTANVANSTNSGFNVTSTKHTGDFNGTTDGGFNVTTHRTGDFNATTDGGFNVTTDPTTDGGVNVTTDHTTDGRFNITTDHTTDGGFNVTTDHTTDGEFNVTTDHTTDSGFNVTTDQTTDIVTTESRPNDTDATTTDGGLNVTTTIATNTTQDEHTTQTSGGITGTTESAPTPKHKLSKGAVAGIVIGCLLAVALVTAAVVFVVKQRGSPETRRLNP